MALHNPEVFKDLKLNSPADSDPFFYKWPLTNPQEIVDNIRHVAVELQAITSSLEDELHNINDIDTSDYEVMKNLCEKYNKSIDSVKALVSMGRKINFFSVFF